MLKSNFVKTIVMGIVAAVAVGTVNAQPVKVTGVSVDYTSKYMWRGFSLFGSQSAVQPNLDIALFGDSGFGLNIWGSIPNGSTTLSDGSGVQSWTEMDYTLSWGTSFFSDSPMQIDFGTNFIYFDYPKEGSTWDVWEIGASADLPNLLPLGICFSYYTGYGESVDFGGNDSMAYHSVGLSKDIDITDTYSISLSAETGYNDQMFRASSDWTHYVVGASLGGIEFSGVGVSPFVYYQAGLEDDFDEVLFGGVSVGYEF